MIEILNKRVESMEKTLEGAEKDLKRNKAIVGFLGNVNDKRKKELNINEFIGVVNTQCDNIEKQVNTLKTMIEKTKEVIAEYESDKDKYEVILTKLLESFGFEEDEIKNS